MGSNKDNFKRIRAEYETKALDAQKEADARRAELYAEIKNVKKACFKRTPVIGVTFYEVTEDSPVNITAPTLLRYKRRIKNFGVVNICTRKVCKKHTEGYR